MRSARQSRSWKELVFLERPGLDGRRENDRGFARWLLVFPREIHRAHASRWRFSGEPQAWGKVGLEQQSASALLFLRSCSAERVASVTRSRQPLSDQTLFFSHGKGKGQRGLYVDNLIRPERRRDTYPDRTKTAKLLTLLSTTNISSSPAKCPISFPRSS